MPRKTEFLIDRCLHRGLVDALKRFDVTAHHLDDVYGSRSEQVQDVEWIEDAGANDWSVITQNFWIIRVPVERDKIVECRTRVFSLSAANYTREAKGFMFGRWWTSIARRSDEPGPCFWRLRKSEIARDLG